MSPIWVCLLNGESLRSQTNNSKYCLSCTIKPHLGLSIYNSPTDYRHIIGERKISMHSYFKQDNVLVGAFVSAYHHPNYDGGVVDPPLFQNMFAVNTWLYLSQYLQVKCWHETQFHTVFPQISVVFRVTQVLCFFPPIPACCLSVSRLFLKRYEWSLHETLWKLWSGT